MSWKLLLVENDFFHSHVSLTFGMGSLAMPIMPIGHPPPPKLGLFQPSKIFLFESTFFLTKLRVGIIGFMMIISTPFAPLYIRWTEILECQMGGAIFKGWGIVGLVKSY